MHHRLAVLALLLAIPLLRADDFDHYTNPILVKAQGHKSVKEIDKLTPALMTDHAGVLPRVEPAVLLVKTNGGRNAKLLVRSAQQRVGEDKRIPVLLVERFVTYKEGHERAVEASGKELIVYPGFRFSLDLGRIVPEEVGGDLRLVVDGDKVHTEALGKAKMALLTAPLPEAKPPKGEKLVVGEVFEPRYFNGRYKLYDDGRRSGELTLKVDDEGNVTGSYFSDRDGAKYEVFGTIGKPQHSIQFTIKFPRSRQEFTGWLFTGDGKAMTGTSKILERESGFYAVRLED